MRSPKRRRIAAQCEWKVDTTRPVRDPSSRATSCETRSRISPAALLVNVSARICHGGTPRSISAAMRRVMTRVLPEPGPASTSAGPSPCDTASRWAAVSLSSRPGSMSGRSVTGRRSYGRRARDPATRRARADFVAARAEAPMFAICLVECKARRRFRPDRHRLSTSRPIGSVGCIRSVPFAPLRGGRSCGPTAFPEPAGRVGSTRFRPIPTRPKKVRKELPLGVLLPCDPNRLG